MRPAPLEGAARNATDYSLVLHLSEPASVAYRESGRWHDAKLFPGSVSLHVPGELPAFRVAAESEIIEVSVNADYLTRAGNGAAPPASFFGATCPQIEHLLRALRAEIGTDCAGGRLFAEHLIAGLCAFLCRDTAGAGRTACGLPPTAKRRVCSYIAAHLTECLSNETLAALCGLSPHHFALRFKESLGVSPHRYVVGERVARAKGLLRNPDATLADIARQTGFAHQSHFAEHFKRIVGATPGQYRRGL